MWIAATILVLSLLISSINGQAVYSAGGGEDSIKLDDSSNETIPVNSKLNATQVETLCLRMHNNTAFMGTQPYARLLLHSASECRRHCIDLYPKCVAVMFYYLHKRDKKHICYLFNKNSIDEDVALVPEKPMKKMDMIRALEIVADCHQFDPFPPLYANFTASTDRVPKKKRDVGFQRPVEITGPWSSWSECSMRTRRQVRSQLCEYGRNIQRRPCSGSSMLRSYGGMRMAGPSVDISISYPPYPYSHPGVSSDEYMRIMSQHSEQVAQACCYWQSYFQQQAIAAGRAGAVSVPGYQLGAGVASQIQAYQPIGTGVCPMPCTPSGGVQLQAPAAIQAQPAQVYMQPPALVYGQPPVPAYVPPSPPTYVSPSPPTYVQPAPPTYVPPSPPTYVQPAPPTYVQPAPPTYVQPAPPTYVQPPAQPQPPTLPQPVPLPPTPRPTYPPGPKYIEPEPQRYPEPPPPTTPIPPVTYPPPTPPLPLWAAWTEWSQCSATCGVGSMQRHRVCATERCEGEIVERRVCDQIVPCVATWAEWGSWSACHATCGTGEKTRSRYCQLGTGRCDGSDYEVERCEEVPCPEWNQWESWSHCSATCGFGTRRRMRTCHGDNCLGKHYEEGECEQEACAEWSQWQAWSTCSVSCGQGTIVRERVCLGRHCDGESMEQNSCVEQACPIWHEWGEWSACSVTCGYGIATRERSCYGSFCPGKRLEVMQCHPGPCAMWSSWQEWSHCSVTCGTGIQRRHRICDGENCRGNAEETQACETGVSCSQWSIWAAWSRCSRDCGIGEMVRHRDCVAADGSTDRGCYGDRTESAACLERPCCEWTPWASWTPCSHNCGGGRSSRTRMCLRSGYEQAEDVSCIGQCYGEDREDNSCNEHIPCATPTYPPTIIMPTVPWTPPPYEYRRTTERPYYPPVQPTPPSPPVYPTPPTTPYAVVPGTYAPAPTYQPSEIKIEPSRPAVVPTAPQVPVVSIAPQVPAAPVAPQVPAVPIAPQVPAVPIVPQVPAVPIAPQVPVAPVAVQVPAVPVVQVPPPAGSAACLSGVGGAAPACYTSTGAGISGLGVTGGAAAFGGTGCHWSTWSGSTVCTLHCGVQRRTRTCLGGGLHCICFGDPVEEVDCSSSPICKV